MTVERRYSQKTSELVEIGLSSTRFLTKEGGKIVSQALVVEYKNQVSVPFGYVVYINTQLNQRGLGLGREILGRINKFLEVNKLTGVLENKIGEGIPGNDWYQKHGWRESIKYLGWMTYGDMAEESQKDEMIEYLINQQIETTYDFEIEGIDIDRQS
ncbi:MAG TPA: hypothetical protein PKZ92_01965 [Candidatus Woesebacteria bacterium]|nr:hypothetical protein [Candidatus Woesebacteria bacterium]